MTVQKEEPMKEFSEILDQSDASFMLTEIQEGGSLGKASMYLDSGYKRQDFVRLRKTYGDLVTVACVAIIATSGPEENSSKNF